MEDAMWKMSRHDVGESKRTRTIASLSCNGGDDRKARWLSNFEAVSDETSVSTGSFFQSPQKPDRVFRKRVVVESGAVGYG